MSTAIQWTDVTDNIIVVDGGGWRCRKISPGCVNCYAEKLNQSTYFDGNKLKYVGEPPKLKLREDVIESWARQTKPKKHFVASMTDVFGDWVPQEWIFEFLDGMAAAPMQTFQVLTKRADIMRERVSLWLERREFRQVPRNIWLGVSVENRDCKKRLEDLRAIRAAVKFASFEPLLEDLKLTPDEVGILNWAIIGGESGPNARRCHIDWILGITELCQDKSVACFVKQLGSFPVTDEATPDQWPAGTELEYSACIDHRLVNLKDRKGGDINEWPTNFRVREFPL